MRYTDWDDNPEPFVWTKPADEIVDEVARGHRSTGSPPIASIPPMIEGLRAAES